MPEYDPKVRHRIYVAQVAAYVLIVTVAVIGFWRIANTQDDLCRTASDNRAAIRGMTEAITRLGINLVKQDDDPSNHLTAGQRRAVAQFRAFRREQVTALDVPVCPGL